MTAVVPEIVWAPEVDPNYPVTPPAEPIEVITEADIDWVAEIEAADEEELEAIAYYDEVRSCCGGRDPWCGHYHHFPPAIEREY
ncbi:hypothetical protein [Mycolicibacter kumamotonensis]|uniref:Uncharacterized protein n=1 Tax=Mycolicibacter kumamotonensis TaxID=354243 RepID=A0A1B8SL12_9MYCO|nr:hypothetical protein [Mycolicibacter kumamotonensis]OBY33425.1 hypothetical protein ACT18_00225 [Mycolicibacter kumamotonensis]